MPQSLSAVYIHLVFSTKERRPFLREQALRESLHAYLGSVSKQLECPPLLVGGVEDHVHILLSLPATMTVAKALQLIKGGSSKWVHDTFPQHRLFAWQEKYGAFSVSASQLDKIIDYIKTQPEHHRKMTFKEEFVALLKKHQIEYDERYLWD